MKRTTGTCYYPEHWDKALWAEDARRMVEAGLTWVRIGEFAWSRIEPTPGDFQWEWLDDAIEVLGTAGLKVVLGTPTATPPRWVADKHPDMFAVDVDGKQRGFGSRRHYCFSHEGYQAEAARIVELFAERYGANPHVAAWQTDNEYGCHDTTISYSDAALKAFRFWLKDKYKTIDALNEAWGNVFWSMEYNDFDQIGLPNLTVTEPNPAHSLNFRRFSSDQVVRFNRIQTDIIRKHSKAPLSHNYMGRVTDFDHYKVGDDLEIATWDSYPLGFLEDRVGADVSEQRVYARQGDPDFQALHHDLYRAVGKGRWWVMEQQPGPVNWAPYNPAPLPGMVRLWSWEAFAHGAEAVCYFRWRQAPMAQEQMHAGLLRPDSADAPAMAEAKQVRDEIANAPDVAPYQAPVAMIFDYDAEFAWAVQPHGQGLSYFSLFFETYKALRKMGLSIDILRPETRDFDGYKLIVAPGLMHMDESLKQALTKANGHVMLGPRTGARDGDMVIPTPLPPAIEGLDVIVSRVESLRPDMPEPIAGGGAVTGYRELLEGSVDVVLRSKDGEAAVVSNGDVTYVAAWLNQTALRRVLAPIAEGQGLDVLDLKDGVRVRDTATERFWFNYGASETEYDGRRLEAASVIREERSE
ncbi:beta-galactosidase [Cognatishimia activa]|uniref:Beta-galactosidase n=1 Tax=Cognatishimia activa TaxID=1715691 RepID=A0A0P1ILZ9_9RHOB|nr:beta-galactosidase [Cognatishimia activa]CUI44556.1 Beta-galactosidase [Cognatishimia activa]CUK24659.1 Beta-galactosidase [Cognatishimia activa]